MATSTSTTTTIPTTTTTTKKSMSEGMTCMRCDCRVVLPGTKLCGEHYRELYSTTESFAKIKERFIRDAVAYHLKKKWDIKISWNKQLTDTTLRPDISFVLCDSLVIIEVDEHQHKKGYDTAKEELRALKLGQVQNQFTYIVRVNPDRYKKHTSIWSKRKLIVSPGVFRDEISMDCSEWARRKLEIERVLDMIIDSIVTRHFSRKKRIDSIFFSAKDSNKREQQLIHMFFD